MLSPSPLSPIRKAWYRWKSLHLPWRKRFLVGLDLQGNTYWEFRDTLSSHKNRMRRIVQYPPSVQYSDIKLSPSWHQWLRHTRPDPPSITEQSQDITRQQNLKVLAAQADARWAAKSSYLDAPGKSTMQALPATQLKDPGEYVKLSDTQEKKGASSAVGGGLKDGSVSQEVVIDDKRVKEGANATESIQNLARSPKETERDPWKQARGGPSEEWQPKAWDGSFTPSKR